MNREILFRGQRLDNDEWAYGDLLHLPNGDVVILSDKGYTKVKPETVGQFTGLTDENGKKIFKGDIIKTREFGKDSGYGVNFNDFDVFEVIYSSASFKLNNARRMFYLSKGQRIEVIGNIYDNPKLLRSENG
jgi:uncharacterized phage protein (TIGR01671 family)